MSGFEVFGLLFAIPPAALQLKQAVDIVRDQYQAFVENDTNMTRVTTVYHNLSEQLPRFSEQLGTHAHLLPPFSLAALTDDLHVIKQRVQRATRELRDITTTDAKRSIVVKFLRSRHVKQDWQQLERDADQLMHAIRHMSVTCTLIDVVLRCHRGQEQRIIHELKALRQSLLHVFPYHPRNTYPSQGGTMDTLDLTTGQTPWRSIRDIDMNFACTVHSPKNPLYVLVDFTSPDAPESRLLSLILRDSSNSNSLPDIYSSRKIELTGKGGRGKTCILRSLCTNHAILSRFTGPGKGGIYYMKFGHNCDANDVRGKLSNMVESSGGIHLRDRILSENISICISILVEWFKHKDSLFLIDEAYDDTDFGASVTEQLVALSTTSTASALVFSRRNSKFTVGEVIRLYPEGDSGSRKMLLSSAGFNAEEIHNATTHEAIDSIVDMCNGNIRLLGQAGVWYKHLYEKGKREAGWRVLADRLSSRLGDRGDENEAQDALITEILSALQAKIGKRLKGAPELHRLYRALHAVKTREWIPVNALCNVWGLKCDECVTVANALLRGRLCRISDRFIGGVMTTGMEIHDCLWEYMYREAIRHGEVTVTA